MNRKQRREADRRRKQGDPEQMMADKIHSFGKLPDKCDACQKAFDKKDRDMAYSWRVVVREQTGVSTKTGVVTRGETVRLFCPECISKTQEAIEEQGRE